MLLNNLANKLLGPKSLCHCDAESRFTSNIITLFSMHINANRITTPYEARNVTMWLRHFLVQETTSLAEPY